MSVTVIQHTPKDDPAATFQGECTTATRRIHVYSGGFLQDVASFIAILAFCASVCFIAAAIALPELPV